MIWYTVAVISPLLWSISNYIDKYLLNTFPTKRGVGTIMVFSTAFSAILLPFIAYAERAALFNVALSQLCLLILVGICSALALLFYLMAMDKGEPSSVIPLLQFIPIFGFVLSHILLGETLSSHQIQASFVILLGVLIASFQFKQGHKMSFKSKVLLYTLLSSFFYALHDTLFKMTTVKDGFWISTFWQYTGMVMVSVSIYLSKSCIRQQVKTMLKNPFARFVGMNLVSETLYIMGNIANNFATMLAPVALVLLVSSIQPLFVFLIAIFLTYFFPKILKEKITSGQMVQKIVSIGIIIWGSYWLLTGGNEV